MSEELKPCPFCGSVDLNAFNRANEFIRQIEETIVCNHCGASCLESKWNTRTPDASGVVEALEKSLSKIELIANVMSIKFNPEIEAVFAEARAALKDYKEKMG